SAGAGDEDALSTFLQEVTLLTDADQADEGESRVTLMTLHASKGLEFPVVFITGLEEGLFPLSQAMQDVKELEEERRLFYVGATRAQDHLYLSYARSRFRYGEQQPGIRSRFLDEVDPEVVRMESGAALRQKSDRFSAGDGDGASYDDMDPHYYRKNLRGASGKRRTRTVRRTKNRDTEADRGRRIVYDEGAVEIVPGTRVEHQKFGEGKVVSLEGRGEQAKAVVFFKGVGQKKLMLKFAGLRVIG
ncbi:MAG: ATP-binding domain-containing protein, partial [Bacteroidetes bacterium]|nr:ATP-binding domain-containing protein [Bacteroidota bacterium]